MSGGSAGGDHYFSARPASAQGRRPLTVRLGGREVELETASGVFSADRLDPGTQVLLREVPDPPRHGNLLDLGCGWGPISLSLALAAPEAVVWGVDVNERALDLLQRNASRVDVGTVRPRRPDDVPDDVRFAALWSNPPIRVGKQVLHDLLLRWLPRLDDGASAYLVVQRNLGADSLQRWLVDQLGASWSVQRHASAKGYRVLHLHAP